MSVAVDVATEGVRIPLSRARVGEIVRAVLRAEKVRDALMSITFLDDARIAAMNRRHLGHRGPTDVISFGFARAGDAGALVGDVYIAPAVARANAVANGVGVREELTRLVVHGVLHTLGYEHPEGGADERARSPMWRRQESIVRRLLARETDAHAVRRRSRRAS